MSALATAGMTTAPTVRVPLSRLVRVELRKQLNTRAARGLLIALVCLTLVLTVPAIWFLEPANLTFAALVNASLLPQMLLVPIVAILSITGEWSHRTTTVTFVLQPARLRVIAAKAAASLVLALVLLASGILFAALSNIAGMLLRDGDGSWSLDPAVLGGTVLVLCLLVVQGLGFGMLVINTPLAIVLWYGLPLGFSTAAAALPALRDVAALTDLNVTISPLADGTMTTGDLLPLLLSAVIWIGVPLVLGTLRTLKREVK